MKKLMRFRCDAQAYVFVAFDEAAPELFAAGYATAVVKLHHETIRRTVAERLGDFSPVITVDRLSIGDYDDISYVSNPGSSYTVTIPATVHLQIDVPEHTDYARLYEYLLALLRATDLTRAERVASATTGAWSLTVELIASTLDTANQEAP